MSDSGWRPEVAVVVPTHRRPEGLRRLLDGLAAQTFPAELWEAVIVDDDSGPDAAARIDELVAAAPFRARVIHLSPNGGPAVARNTGWRATGAPIVAFIDDDCVPRAGWLAEGVGTFSGKTGLVQGRTVRPAGSEAYAYTPFTVVREVLQPSPWFEGCNIFFRREALEQAGGFDESFGTFPCGEDTNLGWTVVGAGWPREWAADAVVEHEVGERPWAWHLRFHWLEGNTVKLAALHPGIRGMFWRPWAVKRENALFAAAVVGAVAGLRWRPALLATIPYLAWLQPGRRVGRTGAMLQVSAHAASLAGKLLAGLDEKTLLL